MWQHWHDEEDGDVDDAGPVYLMKQNSADGLGIMLFYPTIGSTYFVKTQTYVALFGPHQLSIIFSGVMYLELSAL